MYLPFSTCSATFRRSFRPTVIERRRFHRLNGIFADNHFAKCLVRTILRQWFSPFFDETLAIWS